MSSFSKQYFSLSVYHDTFHNQCETEQIWLPVQMIIKRNAEKDWPTIYNAIFNISIAINFFLLDFYMVT